MNKVEETLANLHLHTLNETDINILWIRELLTA